MVTRPGRVAVLGGDGRNRERFAPGTAFFLGGRYGGNGEARRLEAALKSGCYGLLIILTRWNGHSVTRRICKVCKRLGIAFELQP